MKIEEMKTIVVIGAGVMGQQIAMNTAIKGRPSGYQVILCDSFPAAVEKAQAWADKYLAGRIAKGRLTQAQVDEMLQKLVNAITNVMKTEAEAARDALQALISEAEAIDLSHKTTASREAFAQALEDAKAVLADENADAQALDEAYRNLQAAINGLQDIVDSDKSVLEQAIADAKKVNTSLYTKETVDVFEQALKEAEAVMADETATQDQVDAAAKKLIAAQNALQKNPETPADPQDPDEGKPGEGTDSDTAAASALPTTAVALIVSGAAAALMLRKRKHHI